MKTSALTVAGIALAGFMLAAAVPALAQSDEEIIVMGRYGQVPSNVQSLSQAVSYADLDLSTAAGRAELRHRVSLTARYLCGRLGESDSASPVAPSCRDAATKDAMTRVGTVEEGFAPRGTAWAPKSRWQAPYPADWSTRYP
ncbi:UrcA family protein [Sphingobium bisphenolivorans]|uniref:UrcA family protein n=1 Tax=Sphingobium bisphenolivorans TaxID=1335760 RepID=UPI0003A441B0|nr:UrcA family protein [Sphingobium bisphenolivorans]